MPAKAFYGTSSLLFRFTSAWTVIQIVWWLLLRSVNGQSIVFFSHTKSISAISQPTVILSHNKPAPTTNRNQQNRVNVNISHYPWFVSTPCHCHSFFSVQTVSHYRPNILYRKAICVVIRPVSMKMKSFMTLNIIIFADMVRRENARVL